MTYADLLRPTSKLHARLYDVSLVLGGSLSIALLAQVAIPLPFTPVPITGQTLAVLLVGMLLGSRKGALSVVTYLAEGAMGLPFFAAGKAGASFLTGTTGGYLMGFVLAAFVVGWLAEKGWDRNIRQTTLAMILGTSIIFAAGVTWLSMIVGFQHAVVLGLLPFLGGAVVKIILASVLLPQGWKWMGKRSQSDRIN